MFVCDMHQDWADNSLILTHKDFFRKNAVNDWWNMHWIQTNNQVDLPRLKEWEVNLVFGGLALLPWDIEKEVNIKIDRIKEHIEFYDYLLNNSNGEIKSILNSLDLKNIQESWEIGLIKHLEGFYYFDEKDTNFEIVDYFYQLWVRSVALTWNKENNLAGGANSQQWLTEFWKNFIKKIAEKNMILDVAHIWKQSFWDIINETDYPLIMSHTQLQSINYDSRNINDNQALAIAEKGWVVGLMAHPKFLWSNDIKDYINSIKYLVDLVGIDHVAIWSDFDGTTCSELINGFSQSNEFPYLIKNLQKEGFEQNEIEKILWENIKKFILNTIKL